MVLSRVYKLLVLYVWQNLYIDVFTCIYAQHNVAVGLSQCVHIMHIHRFSYMYCILYGTYLGIHALQYACMACVKSLAVS